MTASPYQLLDIQESGELSNSPDPRKSLAHVDCRISPYQLEKLRLLALSVVEQGRYGEVRKADSVTMLYEIFEGHFAGNEKAAASHVCTMLEAVGVNSKHYKRLSRSAESESSNLLTNEEYQWRRSLIAYSDRAERHKKVPVVIDHLYQTHSIELRREDVTSLIALFDHMIEHREIRPGGEEQLETSIEGIFKAERRHSCLRSCLVISAIACLVLSVGFSIPIWIYLSADNTIKFSRNIYYTEPVTFLAADPFDGRYYDSTTIDVGTAVIGGFDFDAELCQARCNAQNAIEKRLDFQNSFTARYSRNRLKFLNTTRTNTANQHLFVVQDYAINLLFTAEGVAPNSNMTIHLFYNVEDCQDYSLNDSFYSENVSQSNQFSYNISSRSPDGGQYLCVVMELTHGANYTYTVTGAYKQYPNTSSLMGEGLCISHSNYQSEGLPWRFHLNRPPSLASNAQPQDMCLYLTLTKREPCYSAICTMYLNSTVHRTETNVEIVSLSIFTGLALFLTCILLFGLSVMCYCKYH